MAVPDYGSLMLPVLRVCDVPDGLKFVQIKRETTATLGATEADLQEVTATGLPLFNHRIEWAIHYLFKAGLLDRLTRGTYRASVRGKKVLQSGVERIDWRYLQQYPELDRKSTRLNSSH